MAQRSLALLLGLLPASRSAKADPHFARCIRAASQAAAYGDGPAVLLQIGAHLAWLNRNDPFAAAVSNSSARGRVVAVLVEPQPHIARQLQAASTSLSNVIVEHAAVCAAASDNITFFSISPRIDAADGTLFENGTRVRLPHWTSQIASLSRRMVVGSLPPRLRSRADEFVVPTVVRCHTVTSLLESHRLSERRVVVLSIDAEGFDTAILESIELSRWRWLRIVNWEHKHAQATAACAALRRLSAAGYVCECDNENMRCYHRRLMRKKLDGCSPRSRLETCLQHHPALDSCLRHRALHRYASLTAQRTPRRSATPYAMFGIPFFNDIELTGQPPSPPSPPLPPPPPPPPLPPLPPTCDACTYARVGGGVGALLLAGGTAAAACWFRCAQQRVPGRR